MPAVVPMHGRRPLSCCPCTATGERRLRNKRTASRAAHTASPTRSHTVRPEPRAPRLDSESHMPEDMFHMEVAVPPAAQQIRGGAAEKFEAGQRCGSQRARHLNFGSHLQTSGLRRLSSERRGSRARGLSPCFMNLVCSSRSQLVFCFLTQTRHDALDHFGSLDIRYLRSIILLLVHYNPIDRDPRNSVST